MEIIKQLPCLLVLLLMASSGVHAAGVIEHNLQRYLLQGDQRNVIVSFVQRTSTVIDKINRLSFGSIEEKRTALTKAQIKFSNEHQKEVQNFLNITAVNYQTLWINNRMFIPKADYDIVQAIAQFPGVAKIEQEKIYELDLPFEEFRKMKNGNFTRQTRQSSVTWGIDRIRANQVWQYYNGRGVVVGTIDTGVRHTHETLAGNWRSNYGWFDPIDKAAVPNDQNGHGTHTMANIVGIYGVGVAPGASWMTCRGCGKEECSESGLTRCGQWIQCPTLPNGASRNCNMAPNLVSCSWGSRRTHGEDSYDDVIRSWHASGIIPIFSIGNGGPNCDTTGSPGDRPNNIGVGAMDMNERIRTRSGRGPKYGRVKPDISAPGSDIVSAWNSGDNMYNSLSGASMATPHVSGVVALMLQKNPKATYNQIYNVITRNTEIGPIEANSTVVGMCGRDQANRFPNNVYGWGRVDAMKAVGAI